LGGAGEAFGHAKREPEIGSQGKPHAGGEQRAGKWIEDGGIDQAGVRRQLVARDRQVGLCGENGVGKAVKCGGTKRAGLWAQYKDGARFVLFGELVSADEIRSCESPSGAGRWGSDDLKRRIGVRRKCFRRSDRHAFRWRKSSQVGKNTFELLRRHGGEQDEESDAGRCGSAGDVENWINCRHGYSKNPC
jgi:hypothetical protein